MLGRSKMKIVRTIIGHLGLLARFTRLRMQRAWRAPGATSSIAIERPEVASEPAETKQGHR
jgi:hypothetical protein